MPHRLETSNDYQETVGMMILGLFLGAFVLRGRSRTLEGFTSALTAFFAGILVRI
jgi:hypothetical protein